jgi:hypothetical protein
VLFVTPAVEACTFHGLADRNDALLNGRLTMPLAVHELGHTLGLRHAHGWHCIALGCTIAEYGNVFSVMGDGTGDFNAYEKQELGWLSAIVQPDGNATHEIGPVDGPTTLPQALVVPTAMTEYWFEARARTTTSFDGDSVQPPGIAVVVGPVENSYASPFPSSNILLRNPSGGSRYAYVAGETFVQQDLFSVTVERHGPERAALRFQWLDRTAPGLTPLSVRAVGRGRALLTWSRARERGSGVKSYTVLADGRAVRVIDAATPYVNLSATLRLTRGRHRVGVFATDRAGNRGPTTSALARIR